jgi:hypothetical protein
MLLPGVVEIFPFQPNLGSITVISKAISELQVGGSIHVRVIGTEFFPECRIMNSSNKSLFKLDKAVEERLRDILAPKLSEPSWKLL